MALVATDFPGVPNRGVAILPFVRHFVGAAAKFYDGIDKNSDRIFHRNLAHYDVN